MGTESRCDTCTHARIIQGYAESERIVMCVGMFDQIRVPFRVMHCTMYEDKRLPDFEQMKEVAWQIRTKSAGHAAGFVLLSDVTESKAQEQQEQEEPQEVPAATSENK